MLNFLAANWGVIVISWIFLAGLVLIFNYGASPRRKDKQ